MGRGGRQNGGTSAAAEDLGAGRAEKLRLIHARLETLLPWRSTNGGPLGMRVDQTGYLDSPSPDGRHGAGTIYAVIGVDSFDAASSVRDALERVAGLSSEEWTTAWTTSVKNLFAIRIYPDVELLLRRQFAPTMERERAGTLSSVGAR